MVSDCEITSQGFPAGARGHDGMATIDGTIIRLSRVFARETYVHVGNHAVHGDKRMLRKPHVRYVLPKLGIMSRAADQNQNVIYVWGPHATPEAVRV